MFNNVLAFQMLKMIITGSVGPWKYAPALYLLQKNVRDEVKKYSCYPPTRFTLKPFSLSISIMRSR